MGLGHPELMREALTPRQIAECYKAFEQEPYGDFRMGYEFAALKQTIVGLFDKSVYKKPLDRMTLKFGAAKTKGKWDDWKAAREQINNNFKSGRVKKRG